MNGFLLYTLEQLKVLGCEVSAAHSGGSVFPCGFQVGRGGRLSCAGERCVQCLAQDEVATGFPISKLLVTQKQGLQFGFWDHLTLKIKSP